MRKIPITANLEDKPEKFPSQYGMVTNLEWLYLEQKRIPGTKVIQNKDETYTLIHSRKTGKE